MGMFAELQKLRKAVRVILRYERQGFLVRNTKLDRDPKWEQWCLECKAAFEEAERLTQ